VPKTVSIVFNIIAVLLFLFLKDNCFSLKTQNSVHPVAPVHTLVVSDVLACHRNSSSI
jgi:hypothetical protein